MRAYVGRLLARGEVGAQVNRLGHAAREVHHGLGGAACIEVLITAIEPVVHMNQGREGGAHIRNTNTHRQNKRKRYH